MSLLEAVVLGLVQGFTEFVPISSSAHLVLVPAALGWERHPVAFDVFLHAGSLLALLAYFRKELFRIAVDLIASGPGRRLAALLIFATIPAVLVGFSFEEQITETFEQPKSVSLFLIGTAVLLAVSERAVRRGPQLMFAREEMVEDLTARLGWARALLIGAGQAAAVFPGFSRSGFTIGPGVLAGLPRPQAAQFSFLLAIPALIGASFFKIPELADAAIGWQALAVGFVASAVSSYLAVAGLIGYLQRRGLYPFAAYCAIVAVLGLLYL